MARFIFKLIKTCITPRIFEIWRKKSFRFGNKKNSAQIPLLLTDTVTISRVQSKPILPPVIAMGGRLREAIEEDTKEEMDDYDEDEDDDEGFVEGTVVIK